MNGLHRCTEILATYRVVTPMFCSGADGSNAEFRLSSFKGAVRFWWRSLMAGTIQDSKQLAEHEARMFGSSSREVGQSKVRFSLVDHSLQSQEDQGKVFEGGNLDGANYLGYGVIQPAKKRSQPGKPEVRKGELLRAMIPGGTFTVRLRLRLSDRQRDELLAAVKLLGTIGGLGSKSRKGFGSLTLIKLVLNDAEQEVAIDPAQRLRQVLSGVKREACLPSWTAWSNDPNVRILQLTCGNSSPNKLLDVIGREQVLYRSWGSNNRGTHSEHRTLGSPSEQNFKADHDLSKPPHRGGGFPHRAVFGLPHNYQTGNVQPVNHDRRASPLFIHIDQFDPSAPAVALLAFLPARFLPEGEQLSAFETKAKLNSSNTLWYPIHGFLDRLISDGKRPASRDGYDLFDAGKAWWNKHNKQIDAREVNLE